MKARKAHAPPSADPVRLDIANECLWRGQERITLKAKAFAVLCTLAEHSGRLVRKEELLQTVWPGIVVSDWVVTTCVREIRRALGDDAKRPRWIETVHRRGYRLLTPLVTTQPISSFKFQVSSLHQSLAPSTQHPSWWAERRNYSNCMDC